MRVMSWIPRAGVELQGFPTGRIMNRVVTSSRIRLGRGRPVRRKPQRGSTPTPEMKRTDLLKSKLRVLV